MPHNFVYLAVDLAIAKRAQPTSSELHVIAHEPLIV
jgi:hypothetical protein